MSTWLSTEPSEYAASGSVAARSTASEIASPSEPSESGSASSAARPAFVTFEGLECTVRAERLHHDAPVGLLPVRDADHEDLALEPVELRRVGERRAPLTGAGLGRDALAPVLRAVERLRHGGVRLVRARRADALVLVVDAHALEAERPLEAIGAHERRRAPDAVGLAHLRGDLVLGLARDLLQDDRHREERRQILGPDGLMRARVQRRRRQRQVGAEVVPVGRQRVLVENDLVAAHARESIPLRRVGPDRCSYSRSAGYPAALISSITRSPCSKSRVSTEISTRTSLTPSSIAPSRW